MPNGREKDELLSDGHSTKDTTDQLCPWTAAASAGEDRTHFGDTVSWSQCELQRLKKLRDPCRLLPNASSVTTTTFKVSKTHVPYRVYPFGFWGKLDVLQEPGDIRQLHPHIVLLLSN